MSSTLKLLAPVVLLLASTTLAAAGDAPADLLARMTDARLAADGGRVDEAAAGFRAVADDARAPDALRADALLAMAAVLAAAGREAESFAIHDEVWSDEARDRDAMARQVAAVTGVLPDPHRWDAVWEQVRIEFDPTSSGDAPRLNVHYPDAHPTVPTSDPTPISISVLDGSAMDIFYLFREVSGLNVVVHPSLRARTMTMEMRDVPWNEVLRRICDAHGLRADVVGNVLHVRRAGDALPGPVAGGRPFDGKPVSIAVSDTKLEDVLALLADASGREIELDPSVKGRSLTMQLRDVPWDQALGLIASTQGLELVDRGTSILVRRPEQSIVLDGTRAAVPLDATMTPPRRILFADPEYPARLKQDGVEGEVAFEVVIDESGRVHPLRLLKGAHPELDRAAREAAAQWTYEPARTADGRPVAIVMTVSVKFETDGGAAR